MKIKSLFIFTIVYFLHSSLQSQPYVEGGNTRHRFAQLNLGIDQRTFFSKGSQSFIINAAGSVEKTELTDQHNARIIIGGTHFWGHADFYIAVPLVSFNTSGLSTGVETGAKYFPWRIQNKKIRPYVGMATLPVVFKQGSGASQVRYKYPFTAGLVFNYKKHLIEFGTGYNHNNKRNYYISKNIVVPVKTHPFWISLGYKYMIETTLSAEKDWQSGETKKLTDTLSVLKKLNGFTLAVGPSSAFFLKKSPHNKSAFPYIDDHKGANLFPEFGIGYYFHKTDLQFNFSYRSIKSKISAYNDHQKIQRKAFTFETYKFISDYHGFAAFIGPAMSYEWLNVSEKITGITESKNNTEIKPGITFGWDIRPNRLQGFYLRTNLRYFPNLNVTMSDGKKVMMDQMEFNFIQLVILPERFF